MYRTCSCGSREEIHDIQTLYYLARIKVKPSHVGILPQRAQNERQQATYLPIHT